MDFPLEGARGRGLYGSCSWLLQRHEVNRVGLGTWQDLGAGAAASSSPNSIANRIRRDESEWSSTMAGLLAETKGDTACRLLTGSLGREEVHDD